MGSKELKVRSGTISYKDRSQWKCLVVAKTYKRMREILNDHFDQNISSNAFSDYWLLGGNNALLVDRTREGVWVGDHWDSPESFECIWPKELSDADCRQITSKVVDYLDGRITLDDMDAWLVSRTWDNADVRCPMSELSVKLALTIQLRLAEYSSSHHTRQELDALLASAVQCWQYR